jgi:putative Flp pilus-assembly TadE/G-like protein
MRHRKQNGQAILMVVVAVGLVLLGALGLVMDGAQIYTNRQMAQLAADAAAEAGIMSVFGGTNTGTNAFGTTSHTCTTSDAITPCKYALFNGFGGTAADSVVVDFPAASAVGVSSGSLGSFSPNIVRVTINRTLNNGLMRLFGASTATVKAIGAAAIVNVVSPIPILVLHPTLSGSFALNGNVTLIICGGPARSVQVNSTSTTAVTVSGTSSTVDLHLAGPKDGGGCTTGTGADFATVGGPTSYPGTVCGSGCTGLEVGTTGHYLDPVTKQPDPLKDIAQPTTPGTAGTSTTIDKTCGTPGNPACTPSCNRCGCLTGNACTLYTPGTYSSILVKGNGSVTNPDPAGFALFAPGLYYINGSGGFAMDSNSGAAMATGLSGTGDYSNGGMMVFFTGSATLNIKSNAGTNGGINLTGSDPNGTYKNILFFEDHGATALSHTLSGGGNMTLQGTIYLTNSTSHNQTLQFQGGAGSNTTIQGELITDLLSLGGGGSSNNIKMNLNPAATVTVPQVALVH